MQPPPYVSLVQTDFVQLGGNVESVFDALTELGMTSAGSRFQIPFVSSSSNPFEDASLIELVANLRVLDVKFGEDYTDLCSPAAYMRELQARGTIDGPFDSIAFRGPGNWVIASVS
mgnify:CR=1 FL=1